MRDDRQRLENVAAIERIERRAAQGKAVFAEDELLQVWIAYHLQIIGEAVRGLSEQTRKTHPEIPWSQIVGMRQILIHQYFGIDLEVVWSVVENDLPRLKATIIAALQSPDSSAGA